MAQPAQIPGFGNATGHQSTATASAFVPPKATQAQVSIMLLKNTGGLR
jgi:hypothetical protein